MAELSPLRVIAFPGAPNLPIFAAIERSFFADAGVRVDLETTPNSRYQMEKLVGGEFDIAATAFDNVVAYQEGQGAVSFAETPDVVAFLGATQIELSFVVAPEVERYEQLKGRSLALDALATGFAFVLYHMLEKPASARAATGWRRSVRPRSAGSRFGTGGMRERSRSSRSPLSPRPRASGSWTPAARTSRATRAGSLPPAVAGRRLTGMSSRRSKTATARASTGRSIRPTGPTPRAC